MPIAVATLLVLAATLSGAHAQSPEAGLTLEQALTMRSVADARVSPDGSLIAYTLSVPRNPLSEDDGAPRKARNPKTGNLEPLAGLARRRRAERRLFEGGP
ncbi:MAG: hypothetical protein HC882_08810 [Acidobacteria bacterium]|nr:hypothetical protein [Acidobacteriota bacterium]